MMMRRRTDRRRLASTCVGIAIVGFAAVLRLPQFIGPDWLVFALAVLGAGMVNPSYVIDLVTAWRGTRRHPHDDSEDLPPR